MRKHVTMGSIFPKDLIGKRVWISIPKADQQRKLTPARPFDRVVKRVHELKIDGRRIGWQVIFMKNMLDTRMECLVMDDQPFEADL